MVVFVDRGRQVPAPVTVLRFQVTRPEAWSFALSAALVVGLASFEGGFYPGAWGWGGLAVSCVAIVGLVSSRRADLVRREWAMLGALAAFLAWIALTATRPDVATAAVPELERGGLYVAALWAALVVVRKETVIACLAGLLSGVVGVCCVALAIYLFPAGRAPDAFEGRLLFRPVGYANAVGIFAGMAVVLALAFAAHASSLRMRALAAGTLVPLVATLAFTGSRASTASVVFALGVVGVLDPARRRLAATAAVALPLPLLAVWAGSRTHLTDAQAGASVVARDGRVFAALIVLLTLALIVIARAALRDGSRVRDHEQLGLLALGVGSVALAAAAGLAVAKGATGAPGDRPAYWRAAWQDSLAHPLLGSGAGSFEKAWLHYRTVSSSTVDAHNLYIETLAELGPLGLVLLAAALVIPITAVAAARRQDPLAVAAAGAYAAFLVHAGLDWDWEVPAVTVPALLCAVAVLKAARTNGERSTARRPRTVALSLVLTCALAAVTAVGLVGNIELAGAASAADRGDWSSAQRLARAASRWQPWSAEPWFVLGETELAAGDRSAARHDFQRALGRNSQDWRTWYEHARVAPGERRQAILEIARLNPLAVRRGAG